LANTSKGLSTDDSVSSCSRDRECGNCLVLDNLLKEEREKCRNLEVVQSILLNDFDALKNEIQNLNTNLTESKWNNVEAARQGRRRWSDTWPIVSRGHVLETVNTFNLLSTLDFPELHKKSTSKKSKADDLSKTLSKDKIT